MCNEKEENGSWICEVEERKLTDIMIQENSGIFYIHWKELCSCIWTDSIKICCNLGKKNTCSWMYVNTWNISWYTKHMCTNVYKYVDHLIHDIQLWSTSVISKNTKWVPGRKGRERFFFSYIPLCIFWILQHSKRISYLRNTCISNFLLT